MATTTLIPNGDGTHAFIVVGGPTLAEAIDDDPASHDGDASYGRGANSVDEVAFVTLSDTPADFNPAGITSITIDFAYREGGTGINNGGAQVFKADEVTPLTDEGVIADPGVAYVRLQFAATQQGSPTKADWDGARLRLNQDRQTGSTHGRFTAARVTIVYSVGLSATLGTATETDSAQPLGRAKRREILAAVETDLALALGRTKAKTIGAASELDVAMALGRLKSRTLGPASETDLALALGRLKARGLGVAMETDLALALGRLKRLPIGVATEVDTAGAFVAAVPPVEPPFAQITDISPTGAIT